MERRKPLRANPEKTREWQRRSRKPLPKEGRKAERERSAVASFRAEVRRRAGGWCEGATPACPPHRHAGAHAHHVWPSDRDRGVHDPERGKLLCAAGHDWTHAHPAEAERRGLLGRSEP